MSQNTKEKILVTGAGGFIGHHLVRFLKDKGYWVRGADIKPPEFSPRNEADEFLLLDLRSFRNCIEATNGIDKVYNFAANMGGIGFITAVKADVVRDNITINTNMAEACRLMGVKRIFFSSSACIYPKYKQDDTAIIPLKESDAMPAEPEDGYGWEKLISERMYKNFYEDYGLESRISRYHNIYGPEGTYEGGREKAPAALSRKIALTPDRGEIEIWGDGKQTRSFCYIDDCLEGTYRLMESDHREPINIGSDRLITVDELADIITSASGKTLSKKYNLSAPQGVRGRNADLTLVKQVLGWEPKIDLEQGLSTTYRWIKSELEKKEKKTFFFNQALGEKVRYSVIGLGKLGSCSATCIASKGFDVIGVDLNQKTVELVNSGLAPVREPGLDDLIQKSKSHLRATDSYREAILNSDITLVIVPTPSENHGGFSLEHVTAAAKEIGKVLAEKSDYHLIDIVSTVLPGSTEYGIKPILEEFSGKKCGPDFGLCYNPEFIALGSVIHNFLNPDFVLIGQSDERAGKLLEQCYKSFCDNEPPIKRMNVISAELAKIALNTYVTTKISYSNMLAELCEHLPGADVDVITQAIGLDKRIGHRYLKAGLGYGGPCFPRDNKALAYIAKMIGTKALIAETTDQTNLNVLQRLTDLVKSKAMSSEKIGILGLTYKPDSPVLEESQGFLLAKNLLEQGYDVLVYDPLIKSTSEVGAVPQMTFADSSKSLLSQSDIIVIANQDPAFSEIKIEDFGNPNPLKKKIVIDCWRSFRNLSGNDFIEYIPMGTGLPNDALIEQLKQLWRPNQKFNV